jgi:hypothetical protein
VSNELQSGGDLPEKELPPITAMPTASAAQALASLHNYKLESTGFETEPVSDSARILLLKARC